MRTNHFLIVNWTISGPLFAYISIMPVRIKKYSKSPKRQVAQKALRIAKSNRSLINTDIRSRNLNLPVAPNTTGEVQQLTNISQGDNVNERQGNAITLKSLKLAGTVTLHASASGSHVRIMIVRDNLGTTTPPVIGDMFSSVLQFNDNKHRLAAPQVVKRFTVLYDRFYMMDTSGLGTIKAIKFSKVLNSKCYFTGTASTNEGKGNLYLFIASNEATNDPVVAVDSFLSWV